MSHDINCTLKSTIISKQLAHYCLRHVSKIYLQKHGCVTHINLIVFLGATLYHELKKLSVTYILTIIF